MKEIRTKAEGSKIKTFVQKGYVEGYITMCRKRGKKLNGFRNKINTLLINENITVPCQKAQAILSRSKATALLGEHNLPCHGNVQTKSFRVTPELQTKFLRVTAMFG
jgi:hypothetical protein